MKCCWNVLIKNDKAMTKHFKFITLIITFLSCGYVYGEGGTNFCLVTDVSTLQEGDTIIIVNKSFSFAMSTSATTTSIKGIKITLEDNTAIANDDVLPVILKKSGKYWLLQSDTDEYICTTTKDKELTTKNTIDTYDKATISIDSGTSEAIITFANKSEYQIGYNSTSNVFKYYKTSGELPNNGEVYIYTSTPRITLDGDSQTADNSSILDGLQDDVEYDITVERTFIGDGGWYTLCLPFALTADDIAETFQEAEFYDFTSVTKGSNGEASLNFEKVSATEAAKPYLVMFPTDVTVENPVIKNKKITAREPLTTTIAYSDEGTDYSFVGIFDPFSVDVYPTAHFVSSNGKSFVKPNSDGTKLKGLRAYFLMPDSSTEAKLGIKGTYTGIEGISNAAIGKDSPIFTIDGKRISTDASGLSQGIYIINGKKALIK